MLFKALGRLTELNDEQFSKQEFPKLVSDSEKLMEFNDSQPRKHAPLILVMVLGRLTVVKEVHSSKQPYSKEVIDSGILMEDKAVQFQKQSSPNRVTELGMAMEANDEQY